MLRFVVRRLLLLVPILLGLSILVFLWIRALPGGPAQALLGERATEESIAQIEREYGLDKPIYVQYWRYVKTVGELDFGQSVTTRRAVTEELRQKFPATVELALAAMIFSTFLGVPLGFFAAKRYGGVFDNSSLVASLIGVSIPVFFLGIILKYIFAVQLGWLPTVGRIDVLIELDHPTNFYILDAIIAGDPNALIDVSKHLILTVIGLQVGFLLAGAVLTETVFAWPGIGTWLVDAIESRNYPVLQGGILFVALIFVVVNLLVDVSYAFLNPRIRLS